MTIGSLFDGSGGFPLAGMLCGHEPIWAAEVKPYPVAVTRQNIPNMKHYGDVTKINGADIEPVDIIAFGSPCQDMSVAGKRIGMKHEDEGDDITTRSGMFFEAMRIVMEMRKATNGKYPRYIIWENVHGAFSSRKGEDFKAVLEAICSICDDTVSIPRPAGNKWLNAGQIVGGTYSVAWRTFDAQYWGVPQRRRRIYLVADFGGQRAQEILFEHEGLRGYSAPGKTEREAVAGNAAGSTAGGCGDGRRGLNVVAMQQNASGEVRQSEVAYTINTNGNATGRNAPNIVYSLQGNGIDRSDTAGCNGAGWREGEMYTLNTVDRPAIAFMAGQGAKAGSIAASETIAPALRGAASGNVVPSACMPNVYHTLTASNARNCESAFRQESYDEYKAATVGSALKAKGSNYGGGSETLIINKPPKQTRKYIVRRLTPTECARLQGFPDWWGHLKPKESMTDAAVEFWNDVRETDARIRKVKYRPMTEEQIMRWYNKLHTDSSEYQMWGNGIALPCALYVMQGV